MENSQNVSNTGTNNSSAILRHELIGQTIAEKYEVKRLLGRGGMGAVYEGKHLLLEKPVAIKVMSTELAEDGAALSRFMREAKTAAKLEHPNAVTIHDFGVWQDNIAYIVMEYISGLALRDVLSKNKTIPPLETVKWMSQVCNAVAAAHNCGIIHRDLKPENIMLKQSGDSEPVIKVVDFGLAKIIKDEEGSAANITKTGEVFGTPYYMGPEFYDGEVVDHQADIYALGVITYEMLSGRPPFYGTIEKIIAAHLFQEPRPLAQNNPDLAPFDPIIAQALKKKRDERLSSASEFASLLRNVLSENPSLAPLGLETASNSTLLSKDLPELAPTMKQASGPITLIPKTAKISSEIPEPKQTFDNQAAKTQSNQIGTGKVLSTSQMSANTLAALPLENLPLENQSKNLSSPQTPLNNPFQNTSIEKTSFPVDTIKQVNPSNQKRMPLIISVAAGALLALGGTVYFLAKPSVPSTALPSPLLTPSTISNPVTTPAVKFAEAESPANKPDGAPSESTNEDTTLDNSNKKPLAAKPKTSSKNATQENANKDNKNSSKDEKNVIVDAASKTGKFFGGIFGKKDKKDEKDKDKKDKKRKDND